MSHPINKIVEDLCVEKEMRDKRIRELEAEVKQLNYYLDKWGVNGYQDEIKKLEAQVAEKDDFIGTYKAIAESKLAEQSRLIGVAKEALEHSKCELLSNCVEYDDEHRKTIDHIVSALRELEGKT